MTEISTAPPITRLLSLLDTHGALLADFDHHPALDLLHVRWHGHLTAASLVHGATAGLALFEGQPFPHRLFSDHLLATGEWAEALPWLQYEWLPQACGRGVQVLAHLLPRGTISPLLAYPGSNEFIAAVEQALRTQSFRHPEPAWQWLAHH